MVLKLSLLIVFDFGVIIENATFKSSKFWKNPKNGGIDDVNFWL